MNDDCSQKLGNSVSYRTFNYYCEVNKQSSETNSLENTVTPCRVCARARVRACVCVCVDTTKS
jgi:hypothetical protein